MHDLWKCVRLSSTCAQLCSNGFGRTCDLLDHPVEDVAEARHARVEHEGGRARYRALVAHLEPELLAHTEQKNLIACVKHE